jgi:hypothetical protein
VDGIGNALCDITDRSYFGNTFPVAHSSMNARDAIIAGSNKTVASLSVSGNVLTITTSAAHGWPAGTWITTAGATDNSFNGTCKLLTSSGSTATCNFTHADGSTTGGTAATSSSAQVYAYYTAKTVPTGSYISRSASVFINPYQEANGRGPDFGDSSIVLGGAQMASLNQNWVTTGLWLYQQPGGITTLRTKYMKFVPHNSAFVMAVMDTGMTQNLWLVDATGKMTTTAMKVNTGVDSTGTGLSHKRVSTGSIAASSSAAVTVTWGAAFANTNYTVNCSVQEATASASTLRVHHIESLTTTTAVVRVVNDDTGAAHTGTLHCMAMHD